MPTMREDLPAASTAGLLVASGAKGNPPSAVLPGRIHAEAGVPLTSFRRMSWMDAGTSTSGWSARLR